MTSSQISFLPQSPPEVNIPSMTTVAEMLNAIDRFSLTRQEYNRALTRGEE